MTGRKVGGFATVQAARTAAGGYRTAAREGHEEAAKSCGLSGIPYGGILAAVWASGRIMTAAAPERLPAADTECL